jgi:hypothetical protein
MLYLVTILSHSALHIDKSLNNLVEKLLEFYLKSLNFKAICLQKSNYNVLSPFALI